MKLTVIVPLLFVAFAASYPVVDNPAETKIPQVAGCFEIVELEFSDIFLIGSSPDESAVGASSSLDHFPDDGFHPRREIALRIEVGSIPISSLTINGDSILENIARRNVTSVGTDTSEDDFGSGITALGTKIRNRNHSVNGKIFDVDEDNSEDESSSEESSGTRINGRSNIEKNNRDVGTQTSEGDSSSEESSGTKIVSTIHIADEKNHGGETEE